MPPSAQAAAQIADVMLRPENCNDRWIPHAAASAAAHNDVAFLKSLAAGAAPLAPRAAEVAAIVAEHYARGRPVDGIGKLFVALAGGNPAVLAPIVGGLLRGWPKQLKANLNPAAEDALGRLFKRLDAGGQAQLLNLASKLGSDGLGKHAEEIVARLMATASNAKTSDDERVAAARELVSLQADHESLADRLLVLVTPRAASRLAVGLVEAVGLSETQRAGAALIGRLGSFTPAARAAAIRVLLTRPQWVRPLLGAIERGQVQWSELSLDQRQLLASYPDQGLARRAQKLLESGGALPNADRQKVLSELAPLASQKGDVAAGKIVFTKACAKCHMHSGQGNKIGPDLSGMAVHPKAELLMHVLDPSRSVEGNFRAYTVLTDDGRVLTGLLSGESKTSIELIDAEAKLHAVQREDIEELTASTKSIMPEGFEKQLQPQELVDLLEFLAAKGRFLPLPLSKVATVTTTKSMFHEGEDGPDRLIFDDWGPKTAFGVPFQLIDPRGQSLANAVMLYGPSGTLPPQMPRSVAVPCNTRVKLLHLLSGISGWGYPASRKDTVSLIVRLHYADGQTEDHELRNGEEFADYIRPIEVPGSKLAFKLGDQQLRYLAIAPRRSEIVSEIEFVKGPDQTAPIIMAATVETQ
jgi:hypothetical protein